MFYVTKQDPIYLCHAFYLLCIGNNKSMIICYSMVKYHLIFLNVLYSIILCMTCFIHPTHKHILLFYSMIFRIWRSPSFRAKHFQEISSSRKFHKKRFFYDEFHPFSFHPCPCGRIFFHVNLDSIMWQKIFQEYFIHFIKIFFKIFYHVHLLMLTCSQDNVIVFPWEHGCFMGQLKPFIPQSNMVVPLG
jgi:hypothetical protein